MLLSSHFKFLDEFHILFTERYSGFLNCTRDLSTNSHRDENLRFEITGTNRTAHIYFLGDTRDFSFIKRYLSYYPHDTLKSLRRFSRNKEQVDVSM